MKKKQESKKVKFVIVTVAMAAKNLPIYLYRFPESGGTGFYLSFGGSIKMDLVRILRAALGFQLINASGIGGQSVTSFKCLYCDKDCSHPNTATPIFCGDYAKKIRRMKVNDNEKIVKGLKNENT